MITRIINNPNREICPLVVLSGNAPSPAERLQAIFAIEGARNLRDTGHLLSKSHGDKKLDRTKRF